MAHGARKAVVTALIVNSVLTVLKFFAAMVSHSASMMNEAVHSLMDSLNQAFLLFGLNAAQQSADGNYAFGHGQKKYLCYLWSAIGLFSIGCGLGLAHAVHAWKNLGHAEPAGALNILGMGIAPVWIAMVVLLIALVLDGYSLPIAVIEFRKHMRKSGDSSYIRALVRADDPTLVAVVLEHAIATLGVLVAIVGIGLATLTGNQMWDVAFSSIIALLLGFAAFFLGAVNMRFLTDVRDQVAETAFVEVAEAHREVERYHGVRLIIIDDSHTVLVAEIELREEAVVAGLQPVIDAYVNDYRTTLSAERWSDEKVCQYSRNRAAARATLERAESVIEELEHAVRQRAHQVHHVTIEVEGLAPRPHVD